MAKQINETDQQFQQRMQDQMIEDQVINDFIKEDIPLSFGSKALIASYGKAGNKEKELYDALAMQVFNKAYEEFVEEFPEKGTGLEFVNFVKLHNPSHDFLHKLRNEAVPEKDPAAIWESVYGQDIGLMRISALKGFRAHSAEPMEEQETIQDLA